MPTCPRCLQGDVGTYVVEKTGLRLQICDECEAAWAPGVEPSSDEFRQLFAIFEEYGLPESWDELVEVAP